MCFLFHERLVWQKNNVLFHPRCLARPCRRTAPFKCYEEANEVDTVLNQLGDEMVDLVTDLINERWGNIPVERWRKLQRYWVNRVFNFRLKTKKGRKSSSSHSEILSFDTWFRGQIRIFFQSLAALFFNRILEMKSRHSISEKRRHRFKKEWCQSLSSPVFSLGGCHCSWSD